ncbi:hypothetical protein [Leptolyngbya sp. 7M]|uniref:hypothetical protein n=1 Tax=Leptolyngbya sp. 7M TaxID=2812896 RepID=UPI001B8BEDDC|nr:hypothetical protein [Leptolyngbya sp. 7M]QYO65589.1 hypothetical protein JVX88_02025 [Leptolyngbya sp. 7M]
MFAFEALLFAEAFELEAFDDAGFPLEVALFDVFDAFDVVVLVVVVVVVLVVVVLVVVAFVVFAGLLAVLFAGVAASPQASPSALRAKTDESAITFFITNSSLLSSSKIRSNLFCF